MIRAEVVKFADAQLRHLTQGTPQLDVVDGVGWEDMTLDERAFVAMHVPDAEVYVDVDPGVEYEEKSVPKSLQRFTRNFKEGRAVVCGMQMPGFIEVHYQSGVSRIKTTIAVDRLRALPQTRIHVAVTARRARR